MPAVESYLTREFEITFLDARQIATEARLNLGVKGYVGKEHEQAVIDEARRIYGEEKRDDERKHMHCYYTTLRDAIQTNTESICGSSIGGDSTATSSSSIDDGDYDDLSREQQKQSRRRGEQQHQPVTRKSSVGPFSRYFTTKGYSKRNM